MPGKSGLGFDQVPETIDGNGKGVFGGGSNTGIGAGIFGILDNASVEEGGLMEIPRHWRLRQQRYQMVGEECPHCEEKIFPPRDICPMCGRGTLENNLGTRIVIDKENNSGDKLKKTTVEKYYEEKGVVVRQGQETRVDIQKLVEN